MNTDTEYIAWVAQLIDRARANGSSYYRTRESLLGRGYTIEDINRATDAISARLTADEQGIFARWLNDQTAERTDVARTWQGVFLSKLPIVGPFFTVRSIATSLDVAANQSGRTKENATRIYLGLSIALILFALALQFSPFQRVVSRSVASLPAGVALIVMLLYRYAIPVIVFTLVFRHIFKRR